MQEIYEQFLLDMPRINVSIQGEQFKDSAVECMQKLKKIYKNKSNYAIQIAIQSTLEPYFTQFTSMFNTFTQTISDGGTQYVEYNNENEIVLYKFFNLIHIQSEQIKKVIILKIIFYPQELKHKATWKSMDSDYPVNWVKDWDIVKDVPKIEESSWTDVLYHWIFPIYSTE